MKERVMQRLESNDRMAGQFGLNRFGGNGSEEWYPSQEKNAAKSRELQAASARGRAAAASKR